MKRRTYPGVNIQWPISELILSGNKVVETRNYPIPKKYLNKEMIMIETPGRNGNFSSRMRAIIVFTDCFKYESKAAFYKDIDLHCVTPDSKWAWTDKPKWGWKLKVLEILPEAVPMKRRTGIKFSKELSI